MISIQWPSWKETGFGEARSTAYRQSGLLSLSNEAGLELFDQLLGCRPGTVVLPALVDAALWRPDELMRPRSHTPQMPAEIPARHPPRRNYVAEPNALVTSAQAWLTDLFAVRLGLKPESLDPEVPLTDYGVESVLLVGVLRAVNAALGIELEPSSLYEYPTIGSFARWLVSAHAQEMRRLLDADASNEVTSATVEPVATLAPTASVTAAEAPRTSRKRSRGEDIAVVGMSCRFPGANGLEEYWQLLSEGRSAIRSVPRARWGFDCGYHAALLDSVRRFDPEFFRIDRADARTMDPQALLVLEESLNAFCHAGYDLSELKGAPIGVYLGARAHVQADEEILRHARTPILVVSQNYLAANVSRFFDLHGPSLVIDTACSSALVAMQAAIQALERSEVSAALVGGVNVLQSAAALQFFEQRELLAGTPAFHIFDARANGSLLGEGAGFVVLKTVKRALEDGDRIYALVKAIAVNNDGRTAGPNAPNLQAKKDVMRAALAASGRSPQEVGYIEVNGAGSELMDLIEIKALESVYGSDPGRPCELGSMKPNIGHPLCAQGIASFIKAVLTLQRGQKVPFLSAQQPMKHYDFASSPFRFSRVLTEWGDMPRVVAVSSFADGGTNAHVILEAWDSDGVPHRRRPLPPPALNRVSLDAPEADEAPAVEAPVLDSTPVPAARPAGVCFWEQSA